MKAFFLVLVQLGCCVFARPQYRDNDGVDGPAKDMPIIPNSDRLPVELLPMEHRHDVKGKLILPNTLSIKNSVFEGLGVDLFFSLWFVFLNNDVEMSGM